MKGSQDAASDDKPKRQVRAVGRRLLVGVTEDERAEICRRAELCRMSVSGFLRAAGLGHPIQSSLDYLAVLELAKVAADLGRLGGLLKLWLTDKRGVGASVADVNRLLMDTRQLQDAIRERMGRI